MSSADVGPGWYVLREPHADPAIVVDGPFDDRGEAASVAHTLTPTGRLMHTPALLYSIEAHDYNVEWGDAAEPPEDLVATDGGVIVEDSFDVDHVPVPAPHAPRVELFESDDGSRWRLEEADRDDAWIEFEPMGVI